MVVLNDFSSNQAAGQHYKVEDVLKENIGLFDQVPQSSGRVHQEKNLLLFELVPGTRRYA